MAKRKTRAERTKMAADMGKGFIFQKLRYSIVAAGNKRYDSESLTRIINWVKNNQPSFRVTARWGWGDNHGVYNTTEEALKFIRLNSVDYHSFLNNPETI